MAGEISTGIGAWATIVGYEGLYEISSIGRVKATKKEVKGKSNGKWVREEKMIKTQISNNGYERVELSKDANKKKWSVHRLVAMAFIPNPDNRPQVNHKNGIRNDNRVENLEWSNQSENMIHAYRIIKSNHGAPPTRPIAITVNGERKEYPTIRIASKILRKNYHNLRTSAKTGIEYLGHKVEFI